MIDHKAAPFPVNTAEPAGCARRRRGPCKEETQWNT